MYYTVWEYRSADIAKSKDSFWGWEGGVFPVYVTDDWVMYCITDKLDYKNKTFPAQIKVLITDMTILQ